MIVISEAVVAARGLDYVADLPMALYANLLTTGNITADEALTDYPVTNLANPLTFSWWKSGSTADQVLTITLDGTRENNSIGIARHNFGSGLVVVSIWGLTGEPGAVLTELVSDQLLGDDSPALFVFASDYYVQLEVHLAPDVVQPQAAVMYVGAALTFPRSVPIGHKPLKYARTRETMNGRSMKGEHLGVIVTSQSLATTFDLKVLPPEWYWPYGQPFVDASKDPFFLAWQPDTDPYDVAYCWATNDPQPTISQITREVDISLSLNGLAL